MTVRGKAAHAVAAGLAPVLILGGLAVLLEDEWPFAFAAGLALAAIYLLFVGYAVASNAAIQNVLLSLAAVSLCFAIAEIGARYLNLRGAQLTADTFRYISDDLDLGYSVAPNQRANMREVDGNQVIFDVNYTINAFGFRETPGPASAPCRAVFFGDSWTFGRGLPDDETLPARFTHAVGGRYRAYNLAFDGYGPHQMLRLLETGRFIPFLSNQLADLVIYQAITDHLARAAGRESWGLRGPRYVLSGDGVRYAGPFHSNLYVFLRRHFLNRSQIVTYLDNRREAGDYLVRRHDLPLFVAIVKAAQTEVARRFHDASFVVLFSDGDDPLGIAARQRLAEAGIPVIPYQQIIPDIYDNDAAYELSANDQHPNLAFNDLVARYLAREVGPERCRRPADAAAGGGPATPPISRSPPDQL